MLLALDTQILDDCLNRHGELGLFIEPDRFAPFRYSLRHDGKHCELIGAGPMAGFANACDDCIELVVDGRERFPLVGAAKTRVLLMREDGMVWMPLRELYPGDTIVVPERNGCGEAGYWAEPRAIRRIKRVPMPSGFDRTRFAQMVVKPHGSFATISAYVLAANGAGEEPVR